MVRINKWAGHSKGKRLTNVEVRERFADEGYLLPNDFTYTNAKTKLRVYDSASMKYTNLSIDQLGHRKLRRYIIPEIESLGNANDIAQESTMKKEKMNRFLDRYDLSEKLLTTTDQKIAYQTFNDLNRDLMRQQAGSINIGEDSMKSQIGGLIASLKLSLTKTKTKTIRLTITNERDQKSYVLVNSTTINLLENLFNMNADNSLPTDSTTNILNSLFDVKEISYEFVSNNANGKGRRRRGGFYPYLNKSGIDLSRYGLYDNVDEIVNCREPCLLTALKHVVSKNEANMLANFIKVMDVPATDLSEIALLINKRIYVHFDSTNSHAYYGDCASDSHSDSQLRVETSEEIKLNIYDNHYFLREDVPFTAFYLKNREWIDVSKLSDHPRKMLLTKYNQESNSYAFAKHGMTSLQLFKQLHKDNLLALPRLANGACALEAIPATMSATMSANNNNLVNKSYSMSRPIQPKNPAKTITNRLASISDFYFKRLFGFPAMEGERESFVYQLETYINNLVNDVSQKLNKYSTTINVRCYRSFSSLMQRLMLETGCFENVYELSGQIANDIRDSITFPKIGTFDNKPLAVANAELYYLDINAAYGFAITGIPTGENADGPLNTKVSSLIKQLYADRELFKAAGNPLAKTLKLLINSCWGYSIRKPRLIKRRVVDDVNASINEFGDLIAGYTVGTTVGDNGKNIVSQVRTFVSHFTYPQFAKTVLDTFNKKIAELSKIVNVLYYNVDAILVNKADYEKLSQLGYIGKEMGQLHVEQIFSEIHIVSARKYYGKDVDGNEIRHLM